MAKGNDGIPMQNWPTPPEAGQDKIHFALGTSDARPAMGYFADIAGLPSEKPIEDAVAGLTDPQEIEKTLVKLLWSQRVAHEYMKWRMKVFE